MSTRSTIWHSDTMHLFYEFIEDKIQLEIGCGPFLCTVPIPIEMIRAVAKYIPQKRAAGKEKSNG